MVFSEETGFTDMDQPVIQYRVWSLWERKLTGLAILALTAGLSFAVYHITDKWYLAFVVCLLLFGSVWRLFIPMQFELSTEGISRWTFGYRRTVLWSDIRAYVFQEEGILILPHTLRYPLDAMRGLFIPIPKKYRIAVQRRFLFYIEKAEQIV